MTEDALASLAHRTGESVERLRDWHTRGLIRGDQAESIADAERVRLIRFLLGRGFDPADVARANSEQVGLLDRFLEVIYPWGPLPQYSFADLIDHEGPTGPLELTRFSWTPGFKRLSVVRRQARPSHASRVRTRNPQQHCGAPHHGYGWSAGVGGRTCGLNQRARVTGRVSLAA